MFEVQIIFRQALEGLFACPALTTNHVASHTLPSFGFLCKPSSSQLQFQLLCLLLLNPLAGI